MRPRLTGRLIPILAAATLLGGLSSAHSQTPPAVTAPPGINMTPAQQARAKARQQQFLKDLTALQANKTMTPAQKNAKAKTLFQSRDADMLAILSPQQRAQVLAQRQAQQKAAQTFQTTHKAEIAAGSTLASRLNKSLTASQKSQITTIRKQLMTQGQGLSADQTLSPQAKQQKWQSDEQDAQTKILAVLTPAQRADYLKMQQMQKQLMSEAGASQAPK